MNPEELEAQRLEQERLAAESQNQQPSTNSNIEELIRTTLAESERNRQAAEARARELEDRLYALQNTPKAPIVQNDNQQRDPNTFWQDPYAAMNSAIAAQVAPLNEFTQQIARQTEYNNLKNSYRQYNGFASIESAVDTMMAGQAPTHANMQIAIQRAVGQLALSGAFNQGGNPSQNNQTQNNPPAPINDPAIRGSITPNSQAPVITPPHLRPSPTSQVPKDNKPQRRALTENERRVLRETNMTEEKYWELMEKGNQVDSWKEKTK